METLVENGDGQLTIHNLPPPAKTKRAPTGTLTAEEKENQRNLAEARKKYGRGRQVRLGDVKDKKLRANLKLIENKYRTAVLNAKDAEILYENQEGFLQPETELEKTYKTRQDDILEAVGIQQAKKSVEFKLDLGPYVSDYTRNGRSLLLAGRKGHIATWKPGCEMHLNETIRDATWLHNDQYFAVAQKKHTYIYDHAGVEIHCLKKYVETTHLEFLPYHFLLAGIENSGFLRYTDTSTGQIVAEHPTRKGAPTALAQNPYNAILHVGHQNGTVSLWSPNSTTPLVKIQSNAGPVRSIAIDRSGHYMLCGGQDLRLKLWDVRALKEVHSYTTRQPATSIDISDRGLAAIGNGTGVTIWKDLFTSSTSSDPSKIQSPYLNWGYDGQRIERVRFCPFDDVLGVSHAQGFSSIIVPGAGEANYDALEVNPYETRKQRQEAEVKSLLTKLQPGTIALDPNFIGTLDTRSAEQRRREKDLDAPAMDPLAKLKERNRGRGKNSALRRHLRKKGGKNVVDEKRLRLEEMKKERAEREKDKLKKDKVELGPALARFATSRR
ncbi:putative U3 small nucleolar RNA-associated protein 7 [Exophiala xenobiotica]|uniref:U three protein 7 n=1 Tax=Vermiconidia calcicola TaxID=1690605 RepID=A0AAV9QDB5_9PEZI|nr:putative U3 small nucleolar RNA-associated protein 7 [Exophiala xenobiotica]KAK5533697.1 putative U3 small nucleolar RNA-associated protein 7 [Chaetothyriales sp. CCFEE 6169]KAK5537861.1 putative U3 small nucleolar RNA-associated protein 7 [Vermiconidia calcicola]KAK5218933.1 putative U3 small nucleolar RNA-associated protein 7 [Exophiala xenobiotica]KAK5235237.1 putative U3 small nucleolar RNA-associated protein 7 [Exophiala xenobiotica]